MMPKTLHYTGDSYDMADLGIDPTTNSARLPMRPRERAALEKTYARWCCGSIIGVIAWIFTFFLMITVPIIVVVSRQRVRDYTVFQGYPFVDFDSSVMLLLRSGIRKLMDSAVIES